MSSSVMSSNTGFNESNDQRLTQNSIPMSESERNLIIDRIIAILSKNKLNPWVDSGLKAEYERRHNHLLPKDWIQVLKDCGRDVIEVEVIVSKTLVQLPIRAVRRQSKTIAPLSVPITQSTTRVPTPPLVVITPEPSEPPLTAEPQIECEEKQEISVKSEPKINSTVGVGSDDEQSVLNMSANTNGLSKVTLNALNSVEPSGGVAEDAIYGGKAIPPVVLPPINAFPSRSDQFFDCVVLLAATPSNFIVVPFNNLSLDSKFSELKHRMFDMYEREENHIDLPPEVISAGMFVASKVRNTWHRMEVRSIVSENPFQVVGYLCDLGEHSSVELRHIQPLYNEFRDLPAQAIRASLATVEPVGQDWDVMTSIEFRRMVENKPFVATVFAIDSVDGQPVLQLSLCDTTGADDLYIGKALVAKRMAATKILTV